MPPVTVFNPSLEAINPDFEEIYRQYSELVYRTAKGVLGNVEDAEDVVQIVFTRLLRHKLTPSVRQNLKAYLYRAAVNQSLVVLKSRRRHLLSDDPARLGASTPVDDSSIEETLHNRLYEAIAKLNPESAELVVLRHVHGKSDAEIAKMLGLSRVAVAVRLFRSRVRLKKLLVGALEVKL